MAPIDDIIAGLEGIRKCLCAYGPHASTCDCKYGGPKNDGGEETGCPELRAAIEILKDKNTINMVELKQELMSAKAALKNIQAILEERQ